MSHFRPKEVLRLAQEAEKNGAAKDAANQYAQLSVYYRKKNKMPDAIAMVSQAIRLSPESGRLYLEEAACFFLLNEMVSVRDSLSKAVSWGIRQGQFDPYLKAASKTFKDQPEIRLEFLRLWLELDRTRVEPFIAFGTELLERQERDEARKIILRGLKAFPKDKSLRDLLSRWGKSFGSKTDLEIIQRFDSEHLSVDKLMLVFGGATLREKEQETNKDGAIEQGQLKDLSELVEELEKKLNFEIQEPFENVEPLIREFMQRSNQVIGNNLQARLDLAYAFFEMERLAEAKLELEKIEMGQELFGQAKYLLGLICLKEGRDIAALGAFQEALRVSDENTDFWKENLYQLTKLFLKLKDIENAKKVFELLSQVDPVYRDTRSFKTFFRNNEKK